MDKVKKDMEEEAKNKIIKAKKSDFKWHEDVHVAFQKAKAREKRETKAKAKKEAAQKVVVEKMEETKKWGQEESAEVINIIETMRSYVMAHNIQCKVKEGCICKLCKKKKRKWYWRMESGWDMVCLACYNLKKGCKVGGLEPIEVEASPLKMESKRKAKVKALVSVKDCHSKCLQRHLVGAERVVCRNLQGL